MQAFEQSNQKFSPASDVAFKNVKNEAVVIHFTSGNYYVLDPVSVFVWETVTKGPHSFSEILDALADEFEVEKSEITPDIRNFCKYMLEENLLLLQS